MLTTSADLVRRLRGRSPSPSMIVALIALFVALSGSAYAALSVPPNSVGTKQLENGAVTGHKLQNGAVTSSKVKDHSLLAKDFQQGQLPTGLPGAQGAQGPPGVQGLQGAQGLQGIPGARGPSDGYAAPLPDVSFGPTQAPPTSIGSLTLPPGNYIAFVRASVYNGLNVTQNVTCRFGPDTEPFGPSPDYEVSIPLATAELQSMTLTGPAVLPSGGKLDVACFQLGPTASSGSLRFSDIQMSAIEVGSLHTG